MASSARHRTLRAEAARELIDVGGKGSSKGKTTLPWSVVETDEIPTLSSWLEQQFSKALSGGKGSSSQ